MFWTFFLFVLGFIFLIKGADLMVDGSSSIAKRFGVSSLFIGLTIVAFGTSAPELIVGLLSAFKNQGDITLGGMIGSNISNTLLILGVAAIISPITIKKSTVHKEIPFSLLGAVALGILLNDNLFGQCCQNILTRADGLILILFFIIFIYYTFGISREEENLLDKAKRGDAGIKEHDLWPSIGMIVLGVVGLFLGGQWIVNGAVAIASAVGISQAFIGLTIVAVGTSLPELAASVVAAKRGQTNIAIGNVVGSNVFNILWITGASSLLKPISYNTVLNLDILILIAITVLLLFLIYIGKRNLLSKKEGTVLLCLYIAYIIFLGIRG